MATEVTIESTTSEITLASPSGVDYIRSTSRGRNLGTIRYPADSAVGANGAPANVRVKLFDPDHAVTGLWFVATRTGTVGGTAVKSVDLGQYFSNVPLRLTAAGEALSISYQPDPDFAGEDGQGDVVSATIADSRNSEAVTLTVLEKLASPSVGASRTEFDAVLADVKRFEDEVRTLQETQAGSPAQPVPTGTSQEASDQHGTVNRLWSSSLLWIASRASSTLSFLASRLGGYVKSLTSSSDQLHLVQVGSDGTESRTTITLPTGSGATQAHTDDQIRNLAGALLGGLAQFSYDASTQTLTFTQSPPSGVTFAELAQSLKDRINAKLDSAGLAGQIDTRLEAPARVGNTDRWGEEKLPLKLDEFLDALSGGTWTASTTSRVSSPPVTAAEPSNPENQTFVTSWSGPRYTSVFFLLKIPEAANLGLLRISVGTVEGGDRAIYPSSGWHFVETVAGFSYYTQAVADIPSGAVVRVEDLTPFELDHSQLGTNAFTDADRNKLAALSVATSVLASHQQIDSETDAALRGFSVALITRLINRFVRHPGAGNLNLPLVATGETSAGFNPLRPAGLHPSSAGSVDASRADDGLGLITTSGGWTTRRYPVAHVTELISANLSGVSVPVSSADHRQQLRLISPNFDLDDANKQSGLVAVETRFTLSGRSSNSIGFDTSLSPQTTIRIGDFVSMADLRATTAYTTARAEGEIVAAQDIFIGSTPLGTIRLFFAKETGTNLLGLYLDYVGASGQSHTYAIACRVLADYIPAGSV